jgi:hypothetical protein
VTVSLRYLFLFPLYSRPQTFKSSGLARVFSTDRFGVHRVAEEREKRSTDIVHQNDISPLGGQAQFALSDANGAISAREGEKP